MKKFFNILVLALLMLGGCSEYDDSSIKNEVNDLKNRVATLEQWATTVNSNITALQNLVSALQNMDYVTGVTTFASPAPGGYVISFVKNGNVTIFNGNDGAKGSDGQDGIDGRDGESPQISVKQDTDGVYYWTLNGEWILADGNKMRVTGERGTDGSNGLNGINPQLRINSGTNIWEVSYDEGSTWISLGVTATGARGQDGQIGQNGQDGQNGLTPQLRVNSGTNIWEVSYDEGNSWTSLGVAATGAKGSDGQNGQNGQDGQNGQNGFTPQLRINSGIWEVSYDEGNIWISLGVTATGVDGQNGDTPQLRVNPETNTWEVSYNEGNAWISLGVAATGANGSDGQNGQNGISPKIRINTFTNEWEISSDNEFSWTPTGIKATGDKGGKGDKGDTGAKGDAVFAANGVDYSNSDYVEFTLADGNTKIKVPKYKKLGLNFTQPGTFAAGQTKTVGYTTEGNVAAIEFLNVPSGWKASVNSSDRTFTVTAPATFNSNNRGGKVIILISDNDQNMIMRTVNFVASDGGGDDGGSGDGGDDNGDDDDGGDEGGSGGGGDDGGGDEGTAGYIAIDGYSGNTLTVYYTDGTSRIVTRNVSNIPADNSYTVPANNKIIEQIVLEGGNTIIAGRKADGSAIAFKLSGGSLVFRDAVDGYIPVGTYSEFQLINTALTGSYKQEDNIDLLDEVTEWIPIGNSSSYFSGTFDGDNYTLANLKISGDSDYAGLFGYNGGTIRNVHIISGSVSGKDNVGGVCGYNGNLISGCSNACLISGSGSRVGGVCGYSYSTSASAFIMDCHNTGSVSGSSNVGGVCGYSYSSYSSYYSIIACYNTGSVSGSGDDVGGVCGYSYYFNSYSSYYSSYSIIACYNTGSVSGSGNVGGVCGHSVPSSSVSSSSSSVYLFIIACYNTGSISGSGNNVGGVCGYLESHYSYYSDSFSSSIIACYNTGSVSGNIAGGVCGIYSSNSSITACYWKDIAGDNADYGTGNPASNTGTSIFALGSWPLTGIHQQWGTGDGSGDGTYWKSIGGWNAGNPIYPKLYFED
jgi:hypothetical protein